MLKYHDGLVIDDINGHEVYSVEMIHIPNEIYNLLTKRGIDPNERLEDLAYYYTGFYMYRVCKESSLVSEDPVGISNHILLHIPGYYDTSPSGMLQFKYMTEVEEMIVANFLSNLNRAMRASSLSREIKYDPAIKVFIITSFASPSSRRYKINTMIKKEMESGEISDPNEFVKKEIAEEILRWQERRQ